MDTIINELVAVGHEAHGKPHLARIRRINDLEQMRRALIYVGGWDRDLLIKALDHAEATD